MDIIGWIFAGGIAIWIFGALAVGAIWLYSEIADHVRDYRGRACPTCRERVDRVGGLFDPDMVASRRGTRKCSNGHQWEATVIWGPRALTSGFDVDSYAP